MIKKLSKSNPLLYKLWFYSQKNKLSSNIKLPDKFDDYYFDGYPRSGNTYIQGLFNHIFHYKKSAHHLHVIAGIKIAKSAGINPILIVIRNPKDAILSNLYRKIYHSDSSENSNDKQTLSYLIDEYLDYYHFIKEQKGIHIICFENFINNKENILTEILQMLDVHYSKYDIQRELKEYDKVMQKKESSKETWAGSLPNKERNLFKKKYTPLIKEFETFTNATKLYKDLIR